MQKVYNEFSNLNQKLEGKVYICDDDNKESITIADYALATQAMDLILLGGNFEKYPNVHSWLCKLMETCSHFKEIHTKMLKALSEQDGITPHYYMGQMYMFHNSSSSIEAL